MSIANEPYENRSDCLGNVIRGHDTWTLDYSKECRIAHLSVPETEDGKVQNTFIMFFDAEGMVHKEFSSQGQSVNAVHYACALGRIVVRVRKDIAFIRPPHHAQTYVCEFQAKQNSAVAALQFRLCSSRLIFVLKGRDRT